MAVEYTIVIQKPKEQRSCNALVTITERVILGHQIKQHGRFLLYTRIELFTSKRLIDLSDATFERVILLIAK